MSTVPSSADDLIAIRDLVSAYAIAMDEADVEAFSRIFVADGALVVKDPGRERPAGVFRGPGADTGVALIAVLMNDLYRATLHHITTHTATVDGDRATGVTYCLAYHMCDDEQGERLETIGVRYDEEFVRTPDGWRMGTREATRLWSQITPTPRTPLVIDHAAAARFRSPRPSAADTTA